LLAGAGGQGGYQYSIDNGATLSANQFFLNLEAGSYDVVVQDMAGCPATGVVVLTQPAALSAVYATQPVTCFGTCNGQLTITANGGTAPYLYSTDGGTTI